MIRTTTLGTQNQLMAYISNNQAAYVKSQQQMSSQQKLSKPSDNAVDSSEVININKKQSDIKTYLDNIGTAKIQTNLMDSVFGQAVTGLQDAYDYALQGSNSTYSTQQLGAIKSSIDQITAGIVDLANTKYNGQSIFSGSNTGTNTYTTDPDGSIVYNGSSSTVDDTSNLEISDGEYIQLTLNGEDIFGSYQAEVTDPGTGAVITPASGTGPLKALNDLSTALSQDPPDYEAIRDCLAPLQDAINQVSDARTEVAGYGGQRLELTESYLENVNTSLTERKSNLQDLDMTSAATDLMNKYYAYQASLQATAQGLSLSLLNYI